VQTNSDFHVLRSTVPSQKPILSFDPEANTKNEDGKDSDDDGDKDGNQSKWTTTKVATPQEITVGAVTSKMSRLVGDKATRSIVTSYIGELDLLDSQYAFHVIFGRIQTIVRTWPASDSNVRYMNWVRQYADMCSLVVFIDVCRQDYVGRVDNNARKNLVQEICKNISDLP